MVEIVHNIWFTTCNYEYLTAALRSFNFVSKTEAAIEKLQNNVRALNRALVSKIQPLLTESMNILAPNGSLTHVNWVDAGYYSYQDPNSVKNSTKVTLPGIPASWSVGSL